MGLLSKDTRHCLKVQWLVLGTFAKLGPGFDPLVGELRFHNVVHFAWYSQKITNSEGFFVSFFFF